MDIMQGIKVAETIVSIAKPIVETVAFNLQKSMKGFAERLIILSEKYPSISEFAVMINKAADFLGDVLFALGINTDHADVLGAKVSQSEKKVDDFDSIEDYIEFLKNEVVLDEDKFEHLSSEEKTIYSIIGIAVEVGAIAEKLGVEITAEAVEMISNIIEKGNLFVKAKDIISIINKLKELGVTNMQDVYECIKGIGDSDRLKTSDGLINALNEVYPGKGEVIITELFDEIRE